MWKERDFTGDMEIFKRQLREAGVTEEEFDITNWVGCTRTELQALTNQAIATHKLNLIKEGNNG